MCKAGIKKLCKITSAFLFILTSTYFIYCAEIPKGEISIEDCVWLAIQNHPELAAYRNRIEQKERDFYISKVVAFPMADINASYSRISYVSPQKQRFIGQSNDDYLAGLNLKQLLFTGGRISAEKRVSEISLNISKEDYKVKEDEVVFRVKNAYYKLVYAKQNLNIQKELSIHMKSFLETASRLNRQRKFPRAETLLRIQSQALEYEHGVIAAQKDDKIAVKILLNAMGFNADEAVQIAEMDEASLPFVKKLGVRENPELLRSMLEIERSKELIKKSRSGYFPSIDLGYSYGYEWGNWPPEKESWFAGIFLKYPLWDWKIAQANTNKAKAYNSEIINTQNLISNRILFEMEASMLKYESAQDRIQLDLSAQEKAKKSLEMFESRYRDASATSIEMLDAQQSYLKARTRYIQSLLELRLAHAEIEKLSGRIYNEFK
ncbi:MAG: hypothetical protein A2539_07710 [Elusimicrobia bacterium RIFOXYD2_FULL_34_15]|nr:MAG: hypothetical protein A2539_07710 [Elusimicrobia bacterium RIFOXYD2_FULL_34_15]